MKKLKIILRHKVFCAILLCIAFVYFILYSNNSIESIYSNFNLEEFVIVNIKSGSKKQVLTLKGKERVIGNYYGEDNFSIGDIVRVSGDKYELINNTVPNTFNYKKYLYNQGIYNFINIKEIELVSRGKNIFYKIKNFAFTRSTKIKKSYSYINGLLLGDNSNIEANIKTSYQENGISHLFAISGLHVSFLILLIDFILKRVIKVVNLRYVIIILFLLFYMFLTGYSMSILRSAIFTILLSINKIFKIEIETINILIFTLVIILFINPLYLYNIGLLFSFVITFYLICFSKIINGNFFRKIFITSFIAFVVSFPIVINNFYQVNFLSIVYNVFFVPFVSYIILPLVICTFIFPFLDNVLYAFIFALEKISMFLNGIGFYKVIFCKMSLLSIIIYYLLVTFVLVLYKKGKAKYLFLILVFMIVHYFLPFNREDYFMMFDVGQGDSSLLYINHKVTLIDTGGVLNYDSDSKYSVVKSKIIPYLKSMGIRKIDNLIFTHGDYDHMGESINLVENFKVEKVIFNCGEFNELEKELIKVLDKKKIKYYSCIKELNIDNNKLYFLQTKEYDNENDNSNVIYTELDGYKFMFMGDAGVEKEKDILNKYNISGIDVLKIGHHGSKTSSDKNFIDEMDPKYSVISVGKNNRYGHPNKEVLNNLSDSKIYRTDQDGSIMFKIKKDKLQIETCSP